MCGRYASFVPAEFLARLFGTVNPPPNLQPTWNLAPTDDAPVVRLDRETGAPNLDVLKWGLISPGSGQTPGGIELLAPVYRWFTEGFDTKDLLEAKSLLDELI